MEDYELNEMNEYENDTEVTEEDKSNTGLVVGLIAGGIAAVGGIVTGAIIRHKKKVAEKERVQKLEDFYQKQYELIGENEVSKQIYADLVPQKEEKKGLFRRKSKKETSKD